MTNLEDHAFGFLLRSIAPMVVSPLGVRDETRTRLRGIVRSSETQARIVLTNDPAMRAGVGFQFPLMRDAHEPLSAGGAIDWVRTVDLDRVDYRANQTNAVIDSHGNTIVDAVPAGFDMQSGSAYDHNLFGLLSILIHGGGFPWFENIYTCAGFMLLPADRVRVYLSLTERSTVWGVEVPLLDPRNSRPIEYGSLPQELASLLRDGGRIPGSTVGSKDDYCAEVFDMSDWVGAA